MFSAPSAVSSAWFPPEERTTATGIALVLNNLGNAVSFLVAPAIVPDPPGGNGTEDGQTLPPYGWPWAATPISANSDSNSSCPDIDPEVRHLIEERVDKLMYTGIPIGKMGKVSVVSEYHSFLTEFGLIAVCFLAILIYFPSKPKRPPSISSSVERMDFVPALKKICT